MKNLNILAMKKENSQELNLEMIKKKKQFDRKQKEQFFAG